MIKTMEPVPAIGMIIRATKGLLSRRNLVSASTLIGLVALNALTAIAQTQAEPPARRPGGEANLRLPDLSRETSSELTGTRCCCWAWSSAFSACCSA